MLRSAVRLLVALLRLLSRRRMMKVSIRSKRPGIFRLMSFLLLPLQAVQIWPHPLRPLWRKERVIWETATKKRKAMMSGMTSSVVEGCVYQYRDRDRSDNSRRDRNSRGKS